MSDFNERHYKDEIILVVTPIRTKDVHQDGHPTNLRIEIQCNPQDRELTIDVIQDIRNHTPIELISKSIPLRMKPETK